MLRRSLFQIFGFGSTGAFPDSADREDKIVAAIDRLARAVLVLAKSKKDTSHQSMNVDQLFERQNIP